MATIIEHCKTVYSEMLKVAEQDGHMYKGCPLYIGSLVKLFNEVGVGQPNYSKIMQALTNMGCVYQLKRGGGFSPSEWVLVDEPTEELAATLNVTKRTGTAPKPAAMGMQQQLRDMNERLASLERWREAVTEDS